VEPAVSPFALEWLRLREPLDLAARNRDVAERLKASLGRPAGRPLRLLDLAAGSGAGFRALAPCLGGDQDWLLADNDTTLLAAQPREIARWATSHGWRVRNSGEGISVEGGEGCWRASGWRVDLEDALDRLDLAAYDAVTTSAFLDLVSAVWLDRLSHALASARRPFLAVLTVDGRRIWRPALAGDDEVLAAFARHQTRPKGFGAALGPAAAPVLADRLAAHGFEVVLASSDWHIGPDARALLRRLLDESVHATCEAEPSASQAFTMWANARRAQLDAGELSLEVGHVDLLALPAAR